MMYFPKIINNLSDALHNSMICVNVHDSKTWNFDKLKLSYTEMQMSSLIKLCLSGYFITPQAHLE